jgi:hypothetical protein
MVDNIRTRGYLISTLGKWRHPNLMLGPAGCHLYDPIQVLRLLSILERCF